MLKSIAVQRFFSFDAFLLRYRISTDVLIVSDFAGSLFLNIKMSTQCKVYALALALNAFALLLYLLSSVVLYKQNVAVSVVLVPPLLHSDWTVG